MKYLDNGYADMSQVINDVNPFVLCIGGRGLGKTYGVLKEFVQRGEPILFMRRTAEQAGLISKQEFSPYRWLEADGVVQDLKFVKVAKNISAVYAGEQRLAINLSLSGVANIRGINAVDYDYIVFDEIVPEAHEVVRASEGDALINMYETLNRNRELNGKKPIKVIMLANAIRLNSPILLTLQVVNRLSKMTETGQSVYRDLKRGLSIYLLQNSPIADKKKDTALYKLVQDAKYGLTAEFSESTFLPVKSYNLRQLAPICKLGELYVMTAYDGYHVSCVTSAGNGPVYGANKLSIAKFVKDNPQFSKAYILGNVSCDSVGAGCILENYMSNRV